MYIVSKPMWLEFAVIINDSREGESHLLFLKHHEIINWQKKKKKLEKKCTFNLRRMMHQYFILFVSQWVTVYLPGTGTLQKWSVRCFQCFGPAWASQCRVGSDFRKKNFSCTWITWDLREMYLGLFPRDDSTGVICIIVYTRTVNCMFYWNM